MAPWLHCLARGSPVCSSLGELGADSKVQREGSLPALLMGIQALVEVCPLCHLTPPHPRISSERFCTPLGFSMPSPMYTPPSLSLFVSPYRHEATVFYADSNACKKHKMRNIASTKDTEGPFPTFQTATIAI